MAAIHIAVKNNDTRGDPAHVLSGTLRNALKLQPNAKIGLASLIYSIPPSLLTIGTNQYVGWATPATLPNYGAKFMRSVVTPGDYGTLADVCIKVQAALNECQTSYLTGGANAMINAPYACLAPINPNTGYQEAYAASVDLKTNISRITRQNAFTLLASDGSAWANQTNVGLSAGNDGVIVVPDANPWSFQYTARSSIGSWFASLDLGCVNNESNQSYGQISFISGGNQAVSVRFELNEQLAQYSITITTPSRTYNLGGIELVDDDRSLLVGVIRAGQFLIVVAALAADDGTINPTNPWTLIQAQNLTGELRDIWYDSTVQISGEALIDTAVNYSLYNFGNVPSTTVRDIGWTPPMPISVPGWPYTLTEEAIADFAARRQAAIEAALIEEAMPWTDIIEETTNLELGAISNASARFSPGDLAQILGFNKPNTGQYDKNYILPSGTDAGTIISDFVPDGGNVELSTINVISNSISLGGAIIDSTGYGDDISLLDVVAGLGSSNSTIVYNGNPPRYVSIRNASELTISELKFTLLASGGGPAKVLPGATIMISIIGANL